MRSPSGRSTPAAALVAGVALAAGVALVACGGGGQPGTGGAEEQQESSTAGRESYRASLEPLAGSGAEGDAILSQQGSTLRVRLRARGLEPRQEHVQHIHRLENGEPGACPARANDDDGNATPSLDDGLAAYGPVGLKLDPFPRAGRRGRTSFRGAFALPSDLEPLSDRVVAVYGRDIDGVYDPTVPVACGRIR